MMTKSALAFVGTALLANAAAASDRIAVFELNGYIPVDCDARLIRSSTVEDGVSLLVEERCNTDYVLSISVGLADQAPVEIVYDGEVRRGSDATFARRAFSGGLHELLVRPLEAGRPVTVTALQVRAVPA